MAKKQHPLGLGLIARSVLTALAEGGPSSAADLAARTNRPKPSIYDGLDELAKAGFVVEESGDGGRVFALADEVSLTEARQSKIAEMTQAYDAVAELARSARSSSKVARPRVRFYTGVDGMRQAFRDTAWNSKFKDAYLMWPMREMIDTLGEEFLRHHGAGREKHGVTIHSIRKESDRALAQPAESWLKNDLSSQNREVRYLSEDADWSMSFWAYGDRTLFAGSGGERFAFVVHSVDFANLMTMLWRAMWAQAKP